MCQKKECKYIEIIEIEDGVKVMIHYNKQLEPIFIQYFDDNKKKVFEFEKTN
jgi:hypothetical protein